MKYPEGHLYEALYAKYIHKRPVTDLLGRAGDIDDKRVLDLCCGTGRLLKGCVARGATVTGVDSCLGMIGELTDWVSANSPDSTIYACTVESYLLYCSAHRVKYDVVFCRQAVNYWLNLEKAELLARSVVPGGLFIFNTFSNKPSEIPVVKEYEYRGHHFVEMSWLVDGMVHHVQVRDGLPPHTTSFMWISPDSFFQILSPYFDLHVDTDDRTTVYVCTRR